MGGFTDKAAPNRAKIRTPPNGRQETIVVEVDNMVNHGRKEKPLIANDVRLSHRSVPTSVLSGTNLAVWFEAMRIRSGQVRCACSTSYANPDSPLGRVPITSEASLAVCLARVSQPNHEATRRGLTSVAVLSAAAPAK